MVGVCGDQVQREGGGRLAAKSRMGAPRVGVIDPIRKDGAGMNRAAEHGFVQELGLRVRFETL